MDERTAGGELAQMVERSLSMREVPGSIPGFSTTFLLSLSVFFTENVLVCQATYGGVETCVRGISSNGRTLA